MFKKIALLSFTVLILSACQAEPVEQEPIRSEKGITVQEPRPNAIVTSPLTVRGTAEAWYFEAEFPIKIVDENGNLLGEQSYVVAQGEWMTADPVPFEGTLIFNPGNSKTGEVIFEKANPSGLPENDLSYSVPVRFQD
jgi:hypothetical protein